jgi:hypothetical protein
MSQPLETPNPINGGRSVPNAAAQGEEAMKAAALTCGKVSPTAPRLLDQLTEAARQQGHTHEAVKAIAEWCRRYVLFHGKRHPLEMGLPEFGFFFTARGSDPEGCVAAGGGSAERVGFLVWRGVAFSAGGVALAARSGASGDAGEALCVAKNQKNHFHGESREFFSYNTTYQGSRVDFNTTPTPFFTCQFATGITFSSSNYLPKSSARRSVWQMPFTVSL